MTKDEQIDGIFGVIDLWACNAVRKRHDGDSVYNPYNAKELAVELYNKNYRKIDDNCAVITKDDLNLYKKQAVKEFATLVKRECTFTNNHGLDLIRVVDFDVLLENYEVEE